MPLKVPRNTENSKSMSNLWRPQMHITGILIYGVGLAFPVLFACKTKLLKLLCQLLCVVGPLGY